MTIQALSKKKVSPDKRGRVSLKGLVEGIDGFDAERLEDGTIVLKPFMMVNAKEAWLFKNKEALKNLKIGIKQAKEGKIKKRKSYAKFADIELD